MRDRVWDDERSIVDRGLLPKFGRRLAAPLLLLLERSMLGDTSGACPAPDGDTSDSGGGGEVAAAAGGCDEEAAAGAGCCGECDTPPGAAAAAAEEEEGAEG